MFYLLEADLVQSFTLPEPGREEQSNRAPAS